ncbi:MAG: efflux RND transporter permease subunit [Deltaproteobacteria bacterium]|jgi:multidrug efflux pump|nr:efflux RND transporter permease subunit [Deltaproteobacteria bacterium]
MSHFFIDRPIFAWVIAIIIMLAGVMGIYTLPVSQYPNIAPPTVTVIGIYSGASAKTVEDSVTQLIEQQMTGIDNLSYMTSTSDASGMSRVQLTFAAGTNPDVAQMQVQNKLQLVTPMMPDVVQRNGLRVVKSSASFFFMVALVNTDNTLNFQDLGDYAVSHLQDPLSRIEGVGEVQMFGSQYSMRIWTDPSLLGKYGLNASDIIAAVQSQNNDINAGYIGGPPAVEGQRISFSVTAQSRMNYIEQFENIIIRTNMDGSMVKLKDVARMELSGEITSFMSRYDGKPCSGIALRLAAGANAIGTANQVVDKMNELSAFFPPNIEWRVGFDTTPFVRISLKEVVKTLLEAIVLVFFLMYLFLQDFRATFIPTIAVPVVLLGTFAAMAAFQFSINTLTMFGMVLAIGLLVDDAIVVVENVERIMHEEHLSPRDAARKSMTQITGALVGIGLVLSAVFIPMAFFGGSTGVIYRQFSITIVSAMLLSVVVALVLTPSLCATFLKPAGERPASGGGSVHQQGVFGAFNRSFTRFTLWYSACVGRILRHPRPMFLVYVLIFGVMALSFARLPTAFLPDEDQGVLMGMVQLPEGATFERTRAVIGEVEKYFLETEKKNVLSVTGIMGFSFGGSGQNVGMLFIRLRDWEERPEAGQKAAAIAARARQKLLFTGEGMVFVIQPPAIMELGTSSGFELELVDNSGQGHDELRNALYMLMSLASQQADKITQVRPDNRGDTAQYRLKIDWEKASAQNLPVSEVITTVSSLWGGYYINNFVDRGRTKKVIMQADAPYRMQPDDFNRIYIRNTRNEMVPFSSIAGGSWVRDSPYLERFNGVSAMKVTGQGVQGFSSGAAMDLMEELGRKLPPGYAVDWTGLSFQERQSRTQAPALYAISLLVVFLCLAALYESWSIPISVMLVVPLGVIGALGVTYLRQMNNDVYFQVGLLTIVGLSAKNAILIVEFAKEMQEKGMDLIEATVGACRLRLRPILMTSFAFMLGVVPLAISGGAGSGGQNAIGTGVLGGMATTTVLGIFFIPIFFVQISRIFASGRKKS